MKTNKLILLLTALVTVYACDKEFLETNPTAELSAEQVGEAVAVNPAAAKGTLLGIYEQFYRFGSGGGHGQEDFGTKINDINTDILSGDLAHTGKSYGRQTGFSELTATVDPSDRFNYGAWRYLYRVINLSNLVIDGLGGDEADLTSDVSKFTIGQAKAARGIAYFYLIHYYIDDISNLSQDAIPLYTNSEQREQPKSTLQQVFDQTVLDLTTAETLLDGFSRSSKIEFNQDIVRGWLAYTYGALNNWAKTAEYAKKVIDSGNYPIMTAEEVAVLGGTDAVGGFNDVNSHPGIMWGIDVTADQELASLYTWWGFMDYFSYSYAAVGNRKAIDLGLYGQIRDDDIRLNQFPFTDFGAGYLVPAGKFYYKGAQNEWAADIPTAYEGFAGPQTNVDSDAHYMRVAEMYLLHAEASAESGNEAVAKESLKALLDLRIADHSYVDALTGEDLLDEISFQTRLELFAEGKSYLLMKRQRQSRTRGANWLDFAGETFQHNDDRLSYELPENELLFNPFIDDQN